MTTKEEYLTYREVARQIVKAARTDDLRISSPRPATVHPVEGGAFVEVCIFIPEALMREAMKEKKETVSE